MCLIRLECEYCRTYVCDPAPRPSLLFNDSLFDIRLRGWIRLRKTVRWHARVIVYALSLSLNASLRIRRIRCEAVPDRKPLLGATDDRRTARSEGCCGSPTSLRRVVSADVIAHRSPRRSGSDIPDTARVSIPSVHRGRRIWSSLPVAGLVLAAMLQVVAIEIDL